MFITLEGVEGAGKTTQREYMRQYLTERGHEVVMTREPGGTPVAEQIREVLLGLRNDEERILPKTEILLFFAARLQHVETVIRPALARGAIVLCDRFTDSTYAYQMAGRQMPYEDIAIIEQYTLGDFRPDAVFLFDLPVEEGLRRAAARGKLDRMEQEAREFFERASLAYLARVQRHPDRYRLINAGKSREEISAVVVQHLELLLAQRQLQTA